MSSVDAKPGLNMMMLDMLKRRQEEDPAKYGCVTLMLDDMAIKKHIQYNPQTQNMSGFVDMGDGMNKTDVATEVPATPPSPRLPTCYSTDLLVYLPATPPSPRLPTCYSTDLLVYLPATPLISSFTYLLLH